MMDVTITCYGCNTELGVPEGHIKHQREIGKSVYCPICYRVLIKNDGKLTVHVTMKEADDDNTTGD